MKRPFSPRRLAVLLLGVLLASGFLPLGAFPLGAFPLGFLPLASAQSIVIDPGHGGNDSGGTGNGMKEKDIVLDTSLRLLGLLRASGAAGGRNWSAEITRETDVFIALSARSAYANSLGVDRFLSIHANAFGDPQANGTETFSLSEPTTSSELRDLIQEEMVSEWLLRDRGGKTANFSVLRRTSMPATLSELGFVTNTGDATLLASLSARQRAAEAHVRALVRHFEGVPDPNPYPNPVPDPTTGSILVAVTLDGAPASGAAVSLDEQAVGSTGEDGSLLVKDLAVGTHLLAVTVPGFAPSEVSVDVQAGQVTAGNFNFDQQTTADLPTGCSAGCSASGGQSALSSLSLLLVLLWLLATIRKRKFRAFLRS